MAIQYQSITIPVLFFKSIYLLISNKSAFHEVLDALLVLFKNNTKLPQSNTPIPTRILASGKYTPYFNDCLGALDGTHIEMRIPQALQSRYRNRKGTISQNVLGVCNFDLRFVFIRAGWEGSAHDGRVLQDAQISGFNTPRGKYWLGKFRVIYTVYNFCGIILVFSRIVH